MTDKGPIVYDGDGTPMRLRMVGAECEGDVSGEGHYAFIPQEQEARESPTVFFESVDVDKLLTASDVLDMMEKRVGRLEADLDRAKNQYVNPDCPECGREMETDSLGGGTITYGCYPPLGSDRDEYDCPYYQEHGRAYTIERNLQDVAPLRRELRAMGHLAREIGRRVGGTDD